jgi:hypothetical protein
MVEQTLQRQRDRFGLVAVCQPVGSHLDHGNNVWPVYRHYRCHSRNPIVIIHIMITARGRNSSAKACGLGGRGPIG